MLHVVTEADKYALYALALANGDVEILRAMLNPSDTSPFDLDALLHRLERNYASVHAERARRHSDPAYFLVEHLKAEIRRTCEPVRTYIQQADKVLSTRIEKLEKVFLLIEDRCTNDDWVIAVWKKVYYLFWHDEDAAWRWLIPRFVEGLAYRPALSRGLQEFATGGKNSLSNTGQRRLRASW